MPYWYQKMQTPHYRYLNNIKKRDNSRPTLVNAGFKHTHSLAAAKVGPAQGLLWHEHGCHPEWYYR